MIEPETSSSAETSLHWTSPAWRMKPRDEWIGWTDQQRR
ncbi:MAG: DUF4338 domain-containing protein [Acidobacteria bacterium]|nr:DUF4338 domain-containing protein [Acidobacteriota bacterium]